MDHLNKLPEITDHVLAGLKADESLKHRIFLSAAATPKERTFRTGTVVALCSLSVLLILLCFFAARFPSGQAKPVDIQVIPAGSNRIVSPVDLQQVIDRASDAASNGISGLDSGE
jgi:hypothetical protein